MKTVLWIALIAVCSGLLAVPALAENRIELYADQNMSSCAIVEPLSPPIVQVHIFMNSSTGATAVRFNAAKPACWVGATWLGDALVTGAMNVSNSQNDWSIAFGKCTVPGEASYLGAISYLISNTALPCCVVDAVPVPGPGYFIYTDCDFQEHTLDASKSIVVNPTESCGCQSGILTATVPSTWGRVKSLYR